MKIKISFILSALLYAGAVFAQTPVASIPFEQYGDHAFIKVKVNGSDDLDFIFDTGDGLTVLNIARAKELGMTSGSVAVTTSAEGTISGKLVKHNEISLGGAPIHNVKIYETELTHLEISIGKDIDGIIGYDVLKNYVVSMDYDEMVIDLYNPKGYKYIGGGKSFDIKLTSYIPHITGAIVFQNDEKIEAEFFVDTGAKATVDFNTPFVESNQLTSKIGDSYIYLVAGIGEKEYEHHRGMVKEFSFGNAVLNDIPVGLSHATSGIQNSKKVSGIIGSGVLRKFNIVYDYHIKKMYWTKNSHYDEGFQINASGIELQLSKDKSKVLVHKVFENSPASAASVITDSEIESVNGKKATDIGLAELRKIFAQDGETVKLIIDGKEVNLTLKSML